MTVTRWLLVVAVALALITFLVCAWWQRERATVHDGFVAAPAMPVVPPPPSRVPIMSSNPFNIDPAAVAGRPVQYFTPTVWPSLLAFAPAAPPTLPTTSLLCDPLDAARWYAGVPQQPAAKPGYFMFLSSAAKSPTIAALPWTGRTIGYTDRSELLLALSLLFAFKVPISAVKLTWVPRAFHRRLPEALERLDFIVAYVVRDTPFYTMIRSQRVFVSGFRGADGVLEATQGSDTYARALLERVRVSYPHVKREVVALRDWWAGDGDVGAAGGGITMSAADMGGAELMSMTQVWVTLAAQAADASKETFLVPYKWDAEALDPRFECVGGGPNASKAECESPRDILGLPKRKRTTWDRPCEEGGDCPFSGECINGFCEMPVGVARASYRTAASGTPMCYGCEDPWDPTCCRGTTVTYVFPNDKGAPVVDLGKMANEIMEAEAAGA